MHIYVLGLLNELTLYKDFNYLVISQYVTYIPRIFSTGYKVQFEDNKLVDRVVTLPDINETNHK
jgi:hypothetical protein